ncbi:MAG: SAP domain-containing protein [Clostridiales bacterium]|jgi:dTDP-glucose pyrophosphorylase|nr:SAP domain-containing protein [Clostridiales bacterium]
MSERPKLDKNLSGAAFRAWYWLKDELVEFLRENGLPVTGGKTELTDRIADFLDTGNVNAPKRTRRTSKKSAGDITPDTVIEENFVCSEKHRAFFKTQLGESFTFNVKFQKWLKSNAGKTYRDAVEAYKEIKKDKGGRKTIDSQFEYNTYIRDFFEHNPGHPLEEAIRCWKYKKSQPGSHKYEDSDLTNSIIK